MTGEHTSETKRLFLAVLPPPEILELIADLPTRARRGVRYTKRHQWHITLRFLGRTDPAAAHAALDRLDAAPATVTVGPAVTLLGARVVVVPAAGLDDLAEATSTAFAGVGEPQPERPFDGHITLARLKGAPLRDPSIVSVIGAPISATFTAAELALVESQTLPEGAVHTVVATNPL